MSYPPEIKKEAIKLHIQGKSVKEIADTLSPRCPSGLELGDRTVRSWITWYGLLKDVVEEQLKKEGYLSLDEKQLEKHRQDMVDIAQTLLANDLEYVSCRHIKEQRLDVKIYAIGNVDGYTENDLSKRLRDNFTKLYDSYNPLLIKLFREHTESGYPEVVKDRFQGAIDKNPYELIEALRFITASRKIEGTCPVCKDL